MCEFNTKITIAQLLRLTIASAKSKIYSPRRSYLSPCNSIVFRNSSYFIIHQRHNYLLILGLILFTLKHASNTPVYFRDLRAYLRCSNTKNPPVSHANLLSSKITRHDKISQKTFPAKNLWKQTTYLLLEAKNPSYFQLRACKQGHTIRVTKHIQLNKFLTVHIKTLFRKNLDRK